MKKSQSSNLKYLEHNGGIDSFLTLMDIHPAFIPKSSPHTSDTPTDVNTEYYQL